VGYKKIVTEKTPDKNLSNSKSDTSTLFLSSEMLYLPINHCRMQMKTWHYDCNVIDIAPQKSCPVRLQTNEFKPQSSCLDDPIDKQVSVDEIQPTDSFQVDNANSEEQTEEKNSGEFLLVDDNNT